MKSKQQQQEKNPPSKAFQLNLLPLSVATGVASVCFFTPLANSRVYENSFALGYTGINQICLYTNLCILGGICLLFSFTILNCGDKDIVFERRAKMIAAHILGIVGAVLLMITEFIFQDVDYKLTKITFIIGQVCIGIYFAICFTLLF